MVELEVTVAASRLLEVELGGAVVVDAVAAGDR